MVFTLSFFSLPMTVSAMFRDDPPLSDGDNDDDGSPGGGGAGVNWVSASDGI